MCCSSRPPAYFTVIAVVHLSCAAMIPAHGPRTPRIGDLHPVRKGFFIRTFFADVWFIIDSLPCDVKRAAAQLRPSRMSSGFISAVGPARGGHEKRIRIRAYCSRSSCSTARRGYELTILVPNGAFDYQTLFIYIRALRCSKAANYRGSYICRCTSSELSARNFTSHRPVVRSPYTHIYAHIYTAYYVVT